MNATTLDLRSPDGQIAYALSRLALACMVDRLQHNIAAFESLDNPTGLDVVEALASAGQAPLDMIEALVRRAVEAEKGNV